MTAPSVGQIQIGGPTGGNPAREERRLEQEKVYGLRLREDRWYRIAAIPNDYSSPSADPP
jgi:hypothetical protein